MSDDPSSSTPPSPTTLRMRPISVSPPFRLTLDYQNVTFKDIDLQFRLTLQSSPNAQLQILQSRWLVGNGGIQPAEPVAAAGRTVHHPRRVTALAIGPTARVRPTASQRDITALCSTAAHPAGRTVQLHWAPSTATCTIDWATGLRLEFDLDVLSGLRRH
jgi:hypothetical protein